ncbi:F-box protein SKIP23 [Rhynchospora pubera]|uniref:F-box protein SKIP23 n=1 Tax=Rhynchospora pubera TaxID=906938 RepID=A0AAV8F046_9POAL|nr:F-box protein SKIP23 [Rhynchospora pubera]
MLRFWCCRGGTEEKEAVKRDWSSLPPEVLNLFAKNLTEISDFVRFRAVCTAWRSSTPVTDLPPQFPWIIEMHRCNLSGLVRFHSLPLGKVYTFHNPQFVCKRPIGMSDGYIRIGTYCLLNPLNNHECVFLPPYNFNGYFHWIEPRQNRMREPVVHVIAFNSVVGCPRLVSCHFGQDKWSELKLESDCINCEPFFYINHILFNVQIFTGVTKVTDVATGTLAYVVPPAESSSPEATERSSDYIVDASGDILRVSLHHGPFGPYAHFEFDDWFDVYRLNVSKCGSACWVKVHDVGHQALFLDKYSGFVLTANDFAGIKRNCIYLLTRVYGEQAPFSRVVRIAIETGAREHLPSLFNDAESWFVPSLQSLN